MKRKSGYSKYIAVLLAFCMVFVMLYFTIFEASNEIHDCTGSDCSICHELQLAENMLKQLGSVISFTVVIFFIVAFCIKAEATFLCSILERTLILDKVRMDD